LHPETGQCIMLLKINAFRQGDTMAPSNYKKWLINILIFVVVIILMVAIAEITMRWIDGYQLNTIELEQNTGE
jgi:flagellar basal body-associated protein FliL